MIEVILAIWASLGFAVLGDTERPNAIALDSSNQQIIRALDSNELQGLNILEAHDADEWFV